MSPGAWQVFTDWRARQTRPGAVKLTKARHRLLAAACRDYPPEALRDVVALAYDAPVGPAGLPEQYARPWRENGPAGLEMLLRRSHVARNVEMAQRWRAGGGVTGSPKRSRGAAWLDRLEAAATGSVDGVGRLKRAVESHEDYGPEAWRAVCVAMRDAGITVSWFRQNYDDKATRADKRARFVAAMDNHTRRDA